METKPIIYYNTFPWGGREGQQAVMEKMKGIVEDDMSIIYPRTSQKLLTKSCRRFTLFRPAAHTDQTIQTPAYRSDSINSY